MQKMTDKIEQQEKDIRELYEFKGTTEQAIRQIFGMIKEIKDNHLTHLNQKINGLLFTVLASVIIAGIIATVRFLMYL